MIIYNFFKKKPTNTLIKALIHFEKLNPFQFSQLDIVYEKHPIIEIFHSGFVESWEMDIETKSDSLIMFIVFSEEKPSNETYLKNFKRSIIFKKLKRSYQLFPGKETYYYNFPNRKDINLIERDIHIMLSEIYEIKSDKFFDVYIRK